MQTQEKAVLNLFEMCAIQSFRRDYTVDEFLNTHPERNWFGRHGHTLNAMPNAKLARALLVGYVAYDESGVKVHEE